jgi:hypothetical protein
VLYSSWGYDQTNVDFYQVTKLVGKNTVEVRAIGNNITDHDGWASGKCVPAIDNFTGQPMKKRVDGNTNSIRVHSFESARLWDGRPLPRLQLRLHLPPPRGANAAHKENPWKRN